MTNSQNLESLIKENKRLLAENEAMREGLQLIANGAEAAKTEVLGKSPHLASGFLEGIEIIAREVLASVAPAAEVEAIAPKFKMGDRVRIVGKQETPPPITDYAIGEYDTIATIEKEGGYKLRYSGKSTASFLVWFDEELIPYTDTD